MVLNHRQRRKRPIHHNAVVDDYSDRDDGDGNKDRFIELAQAALEEATLEDERKGVIYEVVEALIAKTGAPLVAEVISEQLRSQEVIEKLAESHEEEEEQRRRRSKQNVFAPSLLKEPPDAVLQPMDQVIEDDDTSVITAATTNNSIIVNGDNSNNNSNNNNNTMNKSHKNYNDNRKNNGNGSGNHNNSPVAMIRSNSSMLLTAASTSNGRTWLISEYIWRLFRILLLASLVGLVYHFMCAYHQNLF
ncbi:hypothetical protein BDC45DRAFT_520676 [Circinella umbellata]|nr:hypothetical protein BDC45DRAFT_520676 [Circinella umbellata]